MKILEKKCPNCGATLDFKVGERDVVCKSCRKKFAVEYGVEDLSQLSEKALDALKAADISLRPMKNVIIVIAIVFVSIAIIASICSAIAISQSRERFNKQIEQSQEEFKQRSKEMMDSVRQ